MRRSKVGSVVYCCRTYQDQSKTACTRHTIRHDRLEAAVLCVIQQQVSLAVNGTGIIGRINRAPLVKSQSPKEDYEQPAQEEVLQTLRAEQAELENGVDAENPVLTAFHQYQNIDKLTRGILMELVDHIKVYEGGNISIVPRFDDELRRSTTAGAVCCHGRMSR